MRGHYSMGSSESILDADLSILNKSKSLDKLIEQLKGHVKKFNVDASDLAGKRTISPFFTMLYFVLGGILSFVMPGENGNTRQLFLYLLWAMFLGFAAVSGFYVYEAFFAHH